MATKAKYAATQTLLLEPFADDQISEIDGFSYVDPYQYRMRLHAIFQQGFKFQVRGLIVGKDNMTAQAYFSGRVDDVEYEIEVPCAEKFIKASGTDTILKFEQSMNMLISAGLKAVCRELGIGLHLYEKAANKGGSKKGGGGQSAPSGGGAPASSNGPWDGNAAVTFGKHSGSKWRDIEDSYLEYITKDPEKANKLALQEIARRRANNVGEGQSNAAGAVDDDSEIPF